jgi:TRAP-type C4-dicarboxylate transport system substrate-binding protein
MKQSVISVLVLVFAGLLLGGCDLDDDVRVIKLGHGWDASHPVHMAMEYMDERVREKSGGTLRIDVYPSEQLGSERECLELLQIGSLAMTKVSAAVMEGFAPAFRVFSVPYLFRDDDHRYQVMEGDVGRRLLLAG